MLDHRIITTLCSVLFTIVLYACSSQNSSEEIKTPNEEELPDQESWSTKIVLSDSGVTYAIIYAGHIMKYSSEKRIEMDKGVQVDFYNRTNGEHTTVLTSERGIIEEKTNNLKAMENVVVVSDSGITLETESLEWDDKQRKIFSDVDVKITTGQDVIYGKGFISNADLSEWEITKARGYTSRNVKEKK